MFMSFACCTALLQKIQDGIQICLGMSRRRSRKVLVRVVCGYRLGAGIGRVRESVILVVGPANCGKFLLQVQLQLGIA